MLIYKKKIYLKSQTGVDTVIPNVWEGMSTVHSVQKEKNKTAFKDCEGAQCSKLKLELK